MEFLKLDDDKLTLSTGSKYDDDLDNFIRAFVDGKANAAPFKSAGEANSFTNRGRRLFKDRLEQLNLKLSCRTFNKFSKEFENGYTHFVTLVNAQEEENVDHQTEA